MEALDPLQLLAEPSCYPPIQASSSCSFMHSGMETEYGLVMGTQVVAGAAMDNSRLYFSCHPCWEYHNQGREGYALNSHGRYEGDLSNGYGIRHTDSPPPRYCKPRYAGGLTGYLPLHRVAAKAKPNKLQSFDSTSIRIRLVIKHHQWT